MHESKELFEKIVSCLCELCKDTSQFEDEYEDLITILEDHPDCKGGPILDIFGCSGLKNKSAFDIDWYLYHEVYKASYDDGNSAPYCILAWNAEKIEELNQIIKDTAPNLYKKIEQYNKI